MFGVSFIAGVMGIGLSAFNLTVVSRRPPIQIQRSAPRAGSFYFEGADRKDCVSDTTQVQAASFSSENCREDGGATSCGAVGER